MERADQAVQTWQRQSAPHPLPRRVTEHSPGNIPLWSLLPAPGSSWHEKGHGGGGSHAQNVDCRCPSHPDGGEVRSGESGHAGRELAPCLHGHFPPTVEEAEPLGIVQRPGGMLCAREASPSFPSQVYGGIARTRGLTNQTELLFSEGLRGMLAGGEARRSS